MSSAVRHVRWCKCEQQKKKFKFFFSTIFPKTAENKNLNFFSPPFFIFQNFFFCCFWKNGGEKKFKFFFCCFWKNGGEIFFFFCFHTCTIVIAWSEYGINCCIYNEFCCTTWTIWKSKKLKTKCIVLMSRNFQCVSMWVWARVPGEPLGYLGGRIRL